MKFPHDPNDDRALNAFVARMLPLLDPPAGELPDPEQLAALSEGRLGPVDEAALIRVIAGSPAARVELRALFPAVWARHFEDPATIPRLSLVSGGAAPAPRRRRWLPLALGGALAAAAAVFLMLPSTPPESAFGVQSLEVRRRAVEASQPGQRVQLLLDLGRFGWLDRVRGAEPWGALYRVGPDGRVDLLCTSQRGGCRASADTMAWLHVVPDTAGVTRYVFVAGTRPYADAAGLARAANEAGGGWSALETPLERAAEAEGWRVHQRSFEVDPTR